jgi:hypothetical protein
MTTESGWPFLVARGRHKGYRAILAPGFLVDLGLHEWLSEKTAGACSEMRRVELDAPHAGPLDVVYCSEPVHDTELNGRGGGEAATDEHGRPLELLYGIVTRAPLMQPLDQADRSAAREEALRSYRRFLSAEDSFSVESSRPLPLRTAALQTSVPPTAAVGAAPSFAGASRASVRPAAAAGTAVAALGLALLAWQLWPSADKPMPEVRVTGTTVTVVASNPPTECAAGARFALRAVVASDARRSVRYRWEPSSAFAAPAVGTLKLDGKAPQSVEATTLQIVPAQMPRPVRLVITQPSAEPRTSDFDVRCP